MPKFRKRLADIEAVRVDDLFRAAADEQLRRDLPAWLVEACDSRMIVFTGESVIIRYRPDLHGRAWRGDWITRNANGDIYPCSASAFEDTYEPVEG